MGKNASFWLTFLFQKSIFSVVFAGPVDALAFDPLAVAQHVRNHVCPCLSSGR